MPRRPRIQVPGGTYYLLQASSRHQPLFQDDADYRALEQLLGPALERSGTTALGFCWLPHELHLAVRTQDVPISRFMQGFTSRYANYAHRRRRDIGHLFAQRFQSLLIDPERWLPALVRFIHYLPQRAGLAASPVHYPHSSCAAYLGERRIGWLDTQSVKRILRRHGFSALDMRAHLQGSPTPDELATLTANGHRHTRILGDADFLATLPQQSRPSRSRLTLTQLIDMTAHLQGASRDELHSRSRSHAVSLTRALVAWHAMERRIASLTQVAHKFGRDPSTLSKSMARYRRSHPELFRLEALRQAHPLA